MRSVHRHLPALAALASLVAGCGGPGQSLTRLGGGASILPNVGMYVQASTKVDTDGDIEIHAATRIHYQWLDDADLFGDGNPPASDYMQVDFSLFWRTNPLERNHWIFRFGMFCMDAGNDPNLLGNSGNYIGLLVGGGFETSLSKRWTVGPEVAVLGGLNNARQFDIFPQLTWGIRFNL